MICLFIQTFKLTCLLFANDTVLILKNKNKARLQQQINQELTFIDEWMKHNRLSLNYIKTTYFVCAPKCHSSSLKNFTIKIGKHTIPSVESIKYLGVMIDKHLNWYVHIEYVIKKLSYAARILSTVYCHMSYVICRQNSMYCHMQPEFYV